MLLDVSWSPFCPWWFPRSVCFRATYKGTHLWERIWYSLCSSQLPGTWWEHLPFPESGEAGTSQGPANEGGCHLVVITPRLHHSPLCFPIPFLKLDPCIALARKSIHIAPSQYHSAQPLLREAPWISFLPFYGVTLSLSPPVLFCLCCLLYTLHTTYSLVSASSPRPWTTSYLPGLVTIILLKNPSVGRLGPPS